MGAVAGQVHIFQMDGIIPFHHGDFTGPSRAFGFAELDGSLGIQQRRPFPRSIDGALAYGDTGSGRFRGQRCGPEAGSSDIDVVRSDLAAFRGIQAPGRSPCGPDVGIMELYAALSSGGEHCIGSVRFRTDGTAVHG